MIGQLIFEIACRTYPFTDNTREKSMNSFWILHTKQDNGAGSAVLINKNTVITSAHNFNECKPRKSRIISPRTGKAISIKSASIIKEHDLAIVTLSSSTQEPTATIDFNTEVKPMLPVIKGRISSFNPKHGKLETIKGRLIMPETSGIHGSGVANSEPLRSLFHLRSKSGDSGAGIFSERGELLTLNHTGNKKFAVSGTSISEFRRILKQKKLAL
jgi:hypothetical protein